MTLKIAFLFFDFNVFCYNCYRRRGSEENPPYPQPQPFQG
jgi:hypothetical protein